MADSDFFFLTYPISANEMTSFLCLVVDSKTSPLTQFAPSSLLGTKSHNTDDIPSILPSPSVATSKTVIQKTTRELRTLRRRVRVHSRTLESQQVKRYMLSNPELDFQELMKNEKYSQDVRALLKKVRPRHAYLVTGFLTATQSIWTIDGSYIKSRSSAPDEEIFAVSYSDVRLPYTTSNPVIGPPKQAKPYHLALRGSEIDWDSGEC